MYAHGMPRVLQKRLHLVGLLLVQQQDAFSGCDALVFSVI